MDYTLKPAEADAKRDTLLSAGRALAPLLRDEKTSIAIAIVCVVITSSSNLLGPALGAYLANCCIVDELLPEVVRSSVDGVLPVPLHRSRERSRGSGHRPGRHSAERQRAGKSDSGG